MPPPSQAGAGLNAILDEAAALGLTTPALVTKMLNNVEYGRFTADHYIKMWRTRIAEHKAANPAAPAAPRAGAGGAAAFDRRAAFASAAASEVGRRAARRARGKAAARG